MMLMIRILFNYILIYLKS